MPNLRQQYKWPVLEDSNLDVFATHVAHDSLAGAFGRKLTVSAVDADPSNNYDGVECRLSERILVTVQNLSSVTGWAATFWVMSSASEEWMPMESFAGMSTAFSHPFLVAGFKRCFFQITSLSGTSLDVTYKVL